MLGSRHRITCHKLILFWLKRQNGWDLAMQCCVVLVYGNEAQAILDLGVFSFSDETMGKHHGKSCKFRSNDWYYWSYRIRDLNNDLGIMSMQLCWRNTCNECNVYWFWNRQKKTTKRFNNLKEKLYIKTRSKWHLCHWNNLLSVYVITQKHVKPIKQEHTNN